jgi:gluconate 2-dehydrogenase gamma chain
MSYRLSRRVVLRRAAAAGAAAAVPGRLFAQVDGTREPYTHLSPAEGRTLEAIVARLIPSDASGPGALEAGAVRYIDLGLGGALAASRDAYAAGLAALDRYAERARGRGFADLDSDQQDSILASLEQNAPLAPGDSTAFPANASTFLDLVLQHTLEGTFGDPHYGGNRDFIGWAMLGYPGIRLAVGPADQAIDALPEPTNVSAYDLPMFDAHDEEGGV